jgi:hypothetical protein
VFALFDLSFVGLYLLKKHLKIVFKRLISLEFEELLSSNKYKFSMTERFKCRTNVYAFNEINGDILQ